MPDLTPEVAEIFASASFAHLSTLLPDGSPHAVPLWVGVEGGRVAFFTQPTSRKARNIESDPRVALSVVHRDNPYVSAWVRGRVTQTLDGDAALEVIDRISNAYTGKPFPMRSGRVFLVEPEQQRRVELSFEDVPAG